MRTTRPEMTSSGTDTSRQGASVRTALILASIALVFFGGIMYAQYAGEPIVGMSVLGCGVLGFLLVAIGRNLRR